ncbi:MAG TPA: CPBP family intramembrane glutamic endopeptidase [Candidatus Saccharimonadales bacterium]|nr:CPBP family intramembrane glutamic endopeptidase [Candidatus Saccharimonadales bacterium]
MRGAAAIKATVTKIKLPTLRVDKPKLPKPRLPAAAARAKRETARIFKPRWKRAVRWLKPLRKRLLLWATCLALLIGAQATLIWAPRVGVYINAAALVGLSAIAIRRSYARQLAISLAIIPTANLVTASFALHTNFGRTIVLYAALLLMTLVYRFMFTLDFSEFNTRLLKHGYAFGLPLMLVAGQALGALGYLFLRHHYPYTGYSLPLLALMAVVFAFTEEALLRGLIQQRAEQVFHPVPAALMSALLYVFLAFDKNVMLTLPVAVLMGGSLAFVYYKKKNLLLTMTLNAAAKLVYIGLVASFILR